MVIRGDHCGLEESKCPSDLQEGQEEGCRELQTGQAHLAVCECDEANNHGKYFQAFDEGNGSSWHPFLKQNHV